MNPIIPLIILVTPLWIHSIRVHLFGKRSTRVEQSSHMLSQKSGRGKTWILCSWLNGSNHLTDIVPECSRYWTNACEWAMLNMDLWQFTVFPIYLLNIWFPENWFYNSKTFNISRATITDLVISMYPCTQIITEAACMVSLLFANHVLDCSSTN